MIHYFFLKKKLYKSIKKKILSDSDVKGLLKPKINKFYKVIYIL